MSILDKDSAMEDHWTDNPRFKKSGEAQGAAVNAADAELVRIIREAAERISAKRPWVGLTPDEVAVCWDLHPERAMRNVAAKLKEKNA
jgi:hypothetical protein